MQNIARKRLLLLCIILLISVGACNSMFFYPDNNEYSKCSKLSVSCRELSISTSDGALLNAWFLSGPRKNDRLVINFHGNAQNLTAHVRFVYWLPEVGFDVMIFDYRGYGKSPGHPERRQMIEDGKAVLKFASEKYSHEMYVFAQSLGGAIATIAVAEAMLPNLKAMILDSTFGTYRRLARKKLAGFWLTWPFQYPLSWLVSNLDSPEEKISQIMAPVLIVHGTSDKIIPFTEGKMLYEAGKDSVDFWELEGAGHTALFSNREDEVAIDAVRFLCSKSKVRTPCGELTAQKK